MDPVTILALKLQPEFPIQNFRTKDEEVQTAKLRGGKRNEWTESFIDSQGNWAQINAKKGQNRSRGKSLKRGMKANAPHPLHLLDQCAGRPIPTLVHFPPELSLLPKLQRETLLALSLKGEALGQSRPHTRPITYRHPNQTLTPLTSHGLPGCP